jgi:hypothetical protein
LGSWCSLVNILALGAEAKNASDLRFKSGRPHFPRKNKSL